jgi:cytochrome c biogenesis protein CcmG, thiol:disulfide interchange protein DsbE
MNLKPGWFCAAILLGLVGCSRYPTSSVQHSEASASPSWAAVGEIGSHLPDFQVTDFEGKQISSKSLRGKVVLVDIWATWCQPCRKEMPGYQKLFDRYGSRGFVVIGLKSNMMRDTAKPMQFAKEIGIHYPLVSASSELIAKFCKLEGLPTTMVYDRQGLLRKKVIGFDYVENFESAVKPLL